MKIKILDKVLECENQVAAVENMLRQVNQMIAESELALSCLEIDGVEILDEYYQYIVDNIANIEIITVKLKPLKELVADTLVSIQSYIIRVIPEIRQLADEFYQGIGQDSWTKLDQLLEGMQFINQTLDIIMENKEWYYNAEQYNSIHQELKEKISMLHEALENQDVTSIGDLLVYEFTPSLETLNKEINMTLGEIN